MKFTAFDPTTGRIAYSGGCPDDQHELQGGPGLSVIEGEYHEDTHYWDGSAMQPVPTPKPSPFHRFDRATLTWVGDSDAASAYARTRRGQQLTATDWSQLPDVAPETKQRWQPYRQALRDLPTQPGFPFVIEWPTPPAK